MPDVKLIEHNAARYRVPDDPSYPIKLELTFNPPDFMRAAFVVTVGAVERVILRAMTQEALDACVKQNGLDETHPRFIRAEQTPPRIQTADESDATVLKS